MRHDEFIGQVQARARLDSRGAAEAATRASLETLAERIPPPLAGHVAAQLPWEVGEHLRRVATAPDLPATGIRMSPQEFFDRVGQRARAAAPRARQEVQSVMAVVAEATQGSLMDKVRQSVGHDLAEELFPGRQGGAGSAGDAAEGPGPRG